MLIRQATLEDIPFLVEAICEAEKSGTEILSYARLLSISESDFKKALYQILEEDIEGQELCVSHFMVAEENNTLVGAISGWIEASDGVPSAVKKGNILTYFFNEQSLTFLQEKAELLQSISVKRTPGALQIESVYVTPTARGKGIAEKIIHAHFAQSKKHENKPSIAEVILTGDNKSAQKAYEKVGFETKEKKTCEHPKIRNFLPSNTKVLMQYQLT